MLTRPPPPPGHSDSHHQTWCLHCDGHMRCPPGSRTSQLQHGPLQVTHPGSQAPPRNQSWHAQTVSFKFHHGGRLTAAGMEGGDGEKGGRRMHLSACVHVRACVRVEICSTFQQCHIPRNRPCHPSQACATPGKRRTHGPGTPLLNACHAFEFQQASTCCARFHCRPVS